jgi:hypothetical protein
MKKLTQLSTIIILFVFFQACENQEVRPDDSAQESLVDFNSDNSSLSNTESNKRIINYVAHLSGDQEVPPAETNAVGQVKLQLNHDGSELYYKLIVANINNVRFSHIHLAPAGANGPIVVFLYPGPTIESVNGILAEGIITSSDLTGPLTGQGLSDLIAKINDGQTYVNVHTDQVPGGEIRGQIN